MSGMLLGSIDLSKLAAKGAHVVDTVSAANLERVAQLADGGSLQVDLTVETADRGLILVHGTVAGALTLQCQRCLENMVQPLELEIRLAVSADDPATVPAGFEHVVGDARTLRLRNLLEDDILLALPQSPFHEDVAACGEAAALMERYRRNEPDGKTPARANPFAVLNKLKPE